MDQKLISLPNYEILQLLGSGSFGHVFLAFDHTNNRKVAIKRIQKVGKKLSREYEILLELRNSPNTIQILTKDKKLIQNIVFEYMETNLEDMIFKYKLSFPNYSVKSIGRQILEGLKYMHKKTTGCILAELVLSTPLFTAKIEGEQLFKIFSILGSPDRKIVEFWKEEVPFDQKIIDKFPVFEENVLKKCFKGVKSLQRVDLFLDLLQKMFRYDFTARITAEEALEHPFFT